MCGGGAGVDEGGVGGEVEIATGRKGALSKDSFVAWKTHGTLCCARGSFQGRGGGYMA